MLDSPDFKLNPFADFGLSLSPNEKTARAIAQTVLKIDLLESYSPATSTTASEAFFAFFGAGASSAATSTAGASSLVAA